MNMLGQIAKNMVVKHDLRAEVTEALLPVYAKLDAIDAKSERALDETKNLNARLTAIEQKGDMHVDRVTRLEKQISNMRLDNSDGAPSGISMKMIQTIVESHLRVSVRRALSREWSWCDSSSRNFKARMFLFALTHA